MNKKIMATLAAAAVSGSLMAQTLVTVNGTKIDSSEIDRQVKFLQQSGQVQQDSPELRDDLLQRAVVNTLVQQEARRLKLDALPEFKEAGSKARAAAQKQGADKQPDFKQKWADYQNSLLQQAFIVHTVKNNPVGDAEVKAVYDAFKQRYQGQDEVRLGQIMTAKQENAQKAVAELKNKKPFAEVARRYSEEPGAAEHGGMDENYVPLVDFERMPEVYAVVKKLGKGQFNQTPLAGNGVYAVFYVDDKRAVKVPSFDEVKDAIGADLERARVDEALEGLLRKAKIVPAK